MCSNRKGPQTHRYKEPANPHSENKIFFSFQRCAATWSNSSDDSPEAQPVQTEHS